MEQKGRVLILELICHNFALEVSERRTKGELCLNHHRILVSCPVVPDLRCSSLFLLLSTSICCCLAEWPLLLSRSCFCAWCVEPELFFRIITITTA